MMKEEFLSQLEYLLQDIPEDDKRDAIDYYRDYLEEAGPESEEEVLKEFGSPERIASIIRTDLLGGMNDAGQFTESGYDDDRFKTSAYPAVSSRRDGGYKRGGYQGREEGNAASEGARQGGGYRGSNSADNNQGGYRKGSYSENRSDKKEDDWWKYLLIALGILFIGPFALAAVFGAAGTAVGFVITLAVLLLVLAILTAVGVLGGIALVVSGIMLLFGSFWAGLMSIGLGLIFTGAGFLLLCCSWLFYGKFLPWAVMGIVKLCRRLFGKGDDHSGEKTVI